MCTSFCPQCDGDHLNDGPVCLACTRKAEATKPVEFVRNNTWLVADRRATVNRMSLAPDDGERFIPMTAAELAATHARMAASPEPSF